MSAPVKESRGQEMALTVVVAIVIVLLSLLPMLRLVKEIVAPGGALSDTAIRMGLANPATWTATVNTLVVGFGGTALAVVLGTFMALLVTLSDIRGRSMLVLCYVMPLMIAPQVTALAWRRPSAPAIRSIRRKASSCCSACNTGRWCSCWCAPACASCRAS
jgi:iron(III) transport system permease protein